MWKEAFVVSFKVLSQYLFGGTDEKLSNLGYVSHSLAEIQIVYVLYISKSANYFTVTFGRI